MKNDPMILLNYTKRPRLWLLLLSPEKHHRDIGADFKKSVFFISQVFIEKLMLGKHDIYLFIFFFNNDFKTMASKLDHLHFNGLTKWIL